MPGRGRLAWLAKGAGSDRFAFTTKGELPAMTGEGPPAGDWKLNNG